MRAYPISILNWHEVVNDHFGTEAVAVTFCPLCDTGMAFSARVDGRELSFGVSGLLCNSDVLFYDRQSESLWSQILAEAVAGPMKGHKLEFVPTAHTSWLQWRTRHPLTEVLSPDTGYARNYGRDPYAGYVESERLMFPVRFQDQRLRPNERVIGVSIGGEHKAYPFQVLSARAGKALTDRGGGETFKIEFDVTANAGPVFNEEGQEIPSLTAFWFAWFAFHSQA